jgi:hypothetical protein
MPKAVDSRTDLLLNLKRRLRTRFSPEQVARLRKRLEEPAGFVFRRNLRALATIYGTDLWGRHWYAPHYQRYFRPLRHKKITLLLIGNSHKGGNALRMWRRYFPYATIVGVNYRDRSLDTEKHIRIYQTDQSDEGDLQKIIAEVGRPEIVIDDGSHLQRDVIKSFEVLFPLMADDGIYVVEDAMSAYWPDYGGSSDDLHDAPTSMRLFKGLVDSLNYEEFIKPGYVPTYFDRHVTALHFYHNLVFVQKGHNQEGSVLIHNNNPPTSPGYIKPADAGGIASTIKQA